MFLGTCFNPLGICHPKGAAAWMSSNDLSNVRKANQWQNLKLEALRILTLSFVLERQELYLSLGEELETYSLLITAIK